MQAGQQWVGQQCSRSCNDDEILRTLQQVASARSAWLPTPHPASLPQCVALVRKGNSNAFVRVGAYNALTDEALRPVRSSGACVCSAALPPCTLADTVRCDCCCLTLVSKTG